MTSDPTAAAPAAAPSISVRGLVKVYRRSRDLLATLKAPFDRRAGVTALDGISFDAFPGQVIGLLGPNGAGKTTLVKILANLVGPTAGDATVAGASVRSQAIEVRRRVGYVSSDERTFFWRLSGLENLRFFANLYEIPAGVARDRIDQFVQLFRLEKVLHRRFGEASSGQKKLFTIIRGLLSDPTVLLLDEPTNSLDPIAARTLMDTLRHELAVARNRTVIWATHRLEETTLICDRVLLIDRGVIRFDDAVDRFAEERGGSLTDVFERLLADDGGAS